MTPQDRRPQLEALVAKKRKPLHLYALGMEYRNHGDVVDALAAFEAVLEVDPVYHAACFMAAQVHEEQGAIDDAKRELERGIAIAGSTGDSHAEGEMRTMLESLDAGDP